MNRFTFGFCLYLAFGCAFGSRVITYTATSAVSQEEANNSAAAGVATQIATEISSTQVMTKTETKTNGKWNSSKKFSETNKLHSRLFLQGLRIQPGIKQGKRFVATATLDLENATAGTRFQLQEIQRNAKTKEYLIRDALKMKKFKTAIHVHQTLRPLILQYPALLAELSVLVPIDSSMRLKTNADSLEELIIKGLSDISISWHRPPPANTEKGEWGPATLLVRDSEGPIADFPIYAMQDRKILDEEKTNKNGLVSFLFRNVDATKGTHTITFETSLPANYTQNAGVPKIATSYTSNPKTCPYQLSCRESPVVCAAIEEVLNKGGFEKKTNAPKIIVNLTTDKPKTFPTGNQQIISTDVVIALDNHKFSFIQTKKGVGQNLTAAKVSAISKLKPLEIRNKAADFCKE